MAVPPKFWKPVPATQLKPASEGIDWVWEGILARRRITLLSAQAKAGKTTLLSLLLREMGQGGHLLGCKVSRGNVVVVTEESNDDWIIRRDALGIGGYAEFISVPFLTKPSMGDWLELLQEGAADIMAREPDLIVFDTLSHLWPVILENDNGQMQQALMPLRQISQPGPAVALWHHMGAAGERMRGATELEGFVDQVVEFVSPAPKDRTVRERKLTVRGRLTSSPETITASLNDAGDDYQLLSGSLRPIRSGIWRQLAQLLPTEAPGATIRELRGSWPEGEVVPGDDVIHNTLTRCGSKAGVRRTDTKPVGWWLAN